MEEQKLKNQEKQENIHNYLVQVEKQEEIKRNEFYNKRYQIEENVQNLYNERIEKEKEKGKTLEDDFLKTRQNRMTMVKSAKDRLQNIIDKRQELEERIRNKRMEEERNRLRKQQIELIKQFEIDKRIERMQKLKDYDNKMRKEQMEERFKKQEEYRKQKELFARKQKEMSIQMDNEKYAVISKFDNLLRQNRKMNPELIKQIFPEDKELYNRVKELEVKYNVNNNEEEIGYHENEEKN